MSEWTNTSISQHVFVCAYSVPGIVLGARGWWYLGAKAQVSLLGRKRGREGNTYQGVKIGGKF